MPFWNAHYRCSSSSPSSTSSPASRMGHMPTLSANYSRTLLSGKSAKYTSPSHSLDCESDMIVVGVLCPSCSIQCFVSTLSLGAAGYGIFLLVGSDWNRFFSMYFIPLLVFNGWITMVTYLQVRIADT